MKSSNIFYAVLITTMTVSMARVLNAGSSAENSVETEIKNEQTPLITGRDPFWPVGYVPPVQKEPEPVKPPDDTAAPDDDAQVDPPDDQTTDSIKWPRLRVRGITSTLDGSFLAMVEGFGLVENGQVIQITERGHIFRWEVIEVTQKGLNTRRLDARPVK